MTTRILVPLDESSWSRSAAEVAIWIARRGGRSVHLVGLHVVNVTQIRGRLLEDLGGLLGFEPVVVPDQVERHYVHRGERLLARFGEVCEAAGVPWRTVLDRGPVADRLVHHGDQHDLVVMGLRGETEERFPGQGGGSAERVLRKAASSTLVVPRDQHAISGLVLGFDGSAGAGRALRAVSRLAEIVDVPVHAIHVADEAPDPDPLAEAAAHLAHLGLRHTTARLAGEPQEVLPSEAVRIGFDTLGLGYRGRSRLKDVFLGRTTEWLVGHVPVAMLVAR